MSSEVVSTWAAEFDMEDLMAVRVEDDTRENTSSNAPAPELSVVFNSEKTTQPEQIDKLFDKPYEIPHLQNSKVMKSKKKEIKRGRKKMDKFADMFDNAMNNVMDCEGDESDMSGDSDS